MSKPVTSYEPRLAELLLNSLGKTLEPAPENPTPQEASDRAVLAHEMLFKELGHPAAPSGGRSPDQIRAERAALAAAKAAPRCQHIKSDGTRCGSPALKRKRFCHFHHRISIPRNLPLTTLPPFEDANAIQVAIMQITQALLQNKLDLKTANTLLYALQTAASNLKRVSFEPGFERLLQDAS